MEGKGRKFSLLTLLLAATLGIYVASQSMNRGNDSPLDESVFSPLDQEGSYKATGTGLSLGALTEKTEYKCGEKITVECVIFNDAPYAVNTTMPSKRG